MASRTLVGAAGKGDRLEELRILRKVIARSITAAYGAGSWREISPLSGKLIEVGREIDELERAQRKAAASNIPDEPFDASTV